MHTFCDKANRSINYAESAPLELLFGIFKFYFIDLFKGFCISEAPVEVNFDRIAFLDILEGLINTVDSNRKASIIARSIRHKSKRHLFLISSEHKSIDYLMQSSITADCNQSGILVNR